MDKRMIYVILPCYLGKYLGAASNREDKFIRAVNSFLQNDYEHKKLIIVADGCEKTKKLYLDRFTNKKEVRLIYIDKQEEFSGNVRQAGIEFVNNNGKRSDIICYLDSDDMFAPDHLRNMAKYFGENDWVYFADYRYYNKDRQVSNFPQLKYGMIGTSCIAHLNKPEFNWTGCDGYGHDFTFIQRLMSLSDKYSRIRGCGYYVCHIKGVIDN